MRLSRRTLLVASVTVFITIIVGMKIISRLNKAKTQTTSDQQALTIRVEKVSKGYVTDQVKISGTIRPANEVEIFPKISGRIITIDYNVGDQVKAGNVLAIIEHREILLQEQSTKASLIIAKTNEAAAKVDLDRARELFKENAMTKVELEGFELKHATAKAQTMGAQTQAGIADQQLKNARITSLIDGTLVKRMADLGTNVSPQTAIFVVQDISKLKLVTTVDAQTLVRLKKGGRAFLNIEQFGTNIPGKVITLSPSLDSHSRRAAVEIEIDDRNGKLVPNMFVDGTIEISKLEGVLTVPNKAVITSTPKPSLYRVIDGKIQVVSPSLGKSDATNSVVLEGLSEGDLIAVSGLDRLQEGSLVTIKEMAK